tara:strand:+ start:141 stop:311 length:171 start_codon:yes stop_codon:yes gene_type:complete
MELVELINPLTELFAIPKEKRKELFSHYKETNIVKLEQLISAIEKTEKKLFNDKVS